MHSDNTSAKVFQNVFRQHPDVEARAANSLKNLNHKAVHGILKDAGLHNHEELANTIMKRKDLILKHYD